MSGDDYDWIFDFVLQFIESDKFDASVMDFIDEHCDAFDSEEENKFIYTDIHREFKQHMDALISSNLGELGINSEMFFEACEKGRNTRDINRLVFEKLIAMEDFVTFKKLMVKRNIELQVEAMKRFQSFYSPVKSSPAAAGRRGADFDDDEEDDADFRKTAQASGSLQRFHYDADTALSQDDELEELGRQEHQLELEMQQILQNSLLAMELRHREEELELAELEKALAVSLALEEERLALLQADLKQSDFDYNSSSNSRYRSSDSTSGNAPAEAKHSASTTTATASKATDSKGSTSNSSSISSSISSNNVGAGSKDTGSNNSYSDLASPADSKGGPAVVSSGELRNVRLAPATAATTGASFPEPKPLKTRGELKPLPSLKPLGSIDDLAAKRKQAEEEIQRNRGQVAEQRKAEEDLRRQLSLTPSEADERARHMKEQRERIVALKKQERENKVRIEEERKAKAGVDELHANVIEAVKNVQERDAKSAASAVDDESEQRRAAMRAALTRRLKMELIEND